jgi:hypothetical protein
MPLRRFPGPTLVLTACGLAVCLCGAARAAAPGFGPDATSAALDDDDGAAGRIRVAVDAQNRSEAGGGHVLRLGRVVVGALWEPTDQMLVVARAAVVGKGRDDVAPTLGIDDVDVMARAIVWRHDNWHLDVRLGLTLPQPFALHDAQGAPLPLDAQPSVGALGLVVGGGVAWDPEPLRVRAHMVALVFGEGLLGARPAPGGTVDVDTSFAVQERVRVHLTGVLRAGGGVLAPDDIVLPVRVHAGLVTSVACGVDVRMNTDTTLVVRAQVPVLELLRAGESDGGALSVGLLVPLP